MAADSRDGKATSTLESSSGASLQWSFVNRLGARIVNALPPSLRAWLSAHGPELRFLGVWTLLNAIANDHYPAIENLFYERLWFLVPSFDVALLFALYALLGRFQRRVPKALHVAFVSYFVFTRILRYADGVETRYLNRLYRFYIELPLFPELMRLLSTTLPWWKFGGLLLLLAAALVAVIAITHRSLRYAEAALRRREILRVFGALVASFALLSLLLHPKNTDHRYFGLFGASIVGRVVTEAGFIADVNDQRAARVRAISDVQARLARTPSDLSKLHGANVLLIVLESYGATLLERPVFRERMSEAHQRFERALGGAGFEMASALLDSPAYGGGSWLAQATLETGVRVGDQFAFEFLCLKRPKTLAHYFRDAGYRTVLVQPGTTRDVPHSDFYRFDRNYFLWNFVYKGPNYNWAHMPDQYVLDFVRKSEFEHAPRPLFIHYALVTSHAPWSDLPPVVEDWNQLGDGSVYRNLPRTRFELDWSNLVEGSEAYLRSVLYDFEVLQQYLTRYVTDGSLVILVGDHQPVPDVNGHSPSHAVPIHVLSRNAAFLEPFLRRGYVRGMAPKSAGTPAGLESFALNLLEDFSRDKSQNEGT